MSGLWLQLFLSVCLQAETKISSFGEVFEVKNPVEIAQAIGSIEKQSGAFDGQLKGQVHKVCEKKGCWMILKSESQEVRITFKDYGFFVPLDLQQKWVVAQGRLEKKQLSLKEARHYAKDAGLDPKTIKESPTEYHFVATGIRLLSEPQ